MKRRDLIVYLRNYGCVFVREGARHSVFFNPETGRISTVPRHSEIHNFLAKKICRDLGIPAP
ncbi:MAG: type II toxin-antitoxin system HicA family toxin [Candidatus Yanofskybacteria bacterium]|nr:type II toxin-antitoxin system HicA family toxin [Candidatus Yanofskybacteria bacterium]